MSDFSDFKAEYTFTTPLEIFENNLYSFHLKVSDELVRKFTKGNDKRVLVLLNNQVLRPCAIMPHSEGHYLMINREVRKKLKINEGDLVEVQMQKDRSEYGMPLPEEFEAVMASDESGKHYFAQLTPGKQRSLIYLVLKVKNQDSRINKSLAIMHHLNEVHGKLDFKMLNETIKYFNQQKRQGF